MESALLKYDHHIFNLIHKAWKNPVFDFLMPLITNFSYSKYFVVCIALYLIFSMRKFGVKVLLTALLAVGVTDLTCAKVIKPYFQRSRPEFVLQNVNLLVPSQGSPSMPSNHSANSFAIATVLTLYFPGIGPFAFLIAGAVAYSRVYVGVHFPADITVGALVGILMAGIWFQIINSQKKRT